MRLLVTEWESSQGAVAYQPTQETGERLWRDLLSVGLVNRTWIDPAKHSKARMRVWYEPILYTTAEEAHRVAVRNLTRVARQAKKEAAQRVVWKEREEEEQ